MDRTEYQQTIKKFIWVDGDQARDYIALQLVSEVGELLGGYAKRLVGRDITDEYLALEAGDICFFLAWICNLHSIDFSTVYVAEQDHPGWSKLADDMVIDTSEVIYYARAALSH